MEGIITAALSGLGGLPSFVAGSISVAILLFGGILFAKKTNIEEVTSVGTLQHQQIDGLMGQVRFLSEELMKAREQLTEIHVQNIKLMQQVRESNLRIQELEDLVNKRNSDDSD
jgi:TolA-binding protein